MRCPRCDGYLLDEGETSCLNCGWLLLTDLHFTQADAEVDRRKPGHAASHGSGKKRVKM